jgi:hypothetical protein
LPKGGPGVGVGDAGASGLADAAGAAEAAAEAAGAAELAGAVAAAGVGEAAGVVSAARAGVPVKSTAAQSAARTKTRVDKAGNPPIGQ